MRTKGQDNINSIPQRNQRKKHSQTPLQDSNNNSDYTQSHSTPHPHTPAFCCLQTPAFYLRLCKNDSLTDSHTSSLNPILFFYNNDTVVATRDLFSRFSRRHLAPAPASSPSPRTAFAAPPSNPSCCSSFSVLCSLRRYIQETLQQAYCACGSEAAAAAASALLLLCPAPRHLLLLAW